MTVDNARRRARTGAADVPLTGSEASQELEEHVTVLQAWPSSDAFGSAPPLMRKRSTVPPSGLAALEGLAPPQRAGAGVQLHGQAALQRVVGEESGQGEERAALQRFVDKLAVFPDVPYSTFASLKNNLRRCLEAMPAAAAPCGTAGRVDVAGAQAQFLLNCRDLYACLEDAKATAPQDVLAASLLLARVAALARDEVQRAVCASLENLFNLYERWQPVSDYLDRPFQAWVEALFEVPWAGPVTTMGAIAQKLPCLTEEEVEHLFLDGVSNPWALTPQAKQQWRAECQGFLACSQVRDDIFVSSISTAVDLEALQARGITHVVSCFGNAIFPDKLKYLCLAVADVAEQNLEQHFAEVFDFVQQARREGGKVLLHCQKGRSRSVALCAATLMALEGFDVEQALMEIRRCRPVAQPNAGFMQQLMRWNSTLRPSPLAG